MLLHIGKSLAKLHFAPTSFAPLTSEVRYKALLRGTPNGKQATNSAAEQRECYTTFGQAFCKRLVAIGSHFDVSPMEKIPIAISFFHTRYFDYARNIDGNYRLANEDFPLNLTVSILRKTFIHKSITHMNG